MDNKIVLTMIYDSDEIKVPPFSLMYVGGALKKAGFEVRVLHEVFNNSNRVLQVIEQERPLFAGFSVLSGPPVFYAATLSKKIKNRLDIPVVWGGIHPSLLPEQCLKEDYIDMVVIGEGEETAIELAKALADKSPLEGVSGVGYKDWKGNIMVNPFRPFIANLDAYRMDFSLVDMTRYINERIEVSENKERQTRRSLGYITSRGCPYSCGFCYNLNFNRRKWRTYSTSVVVDDINSLKDKYNINEIHFWDDNFMVDEVRAFKILDNIGVYPGIEIRIDALNEGLVSRLKDLDTDQLLIGIESGSDRILNLINKGFDSGEILRKARLLAKYKVSALYSLILGIPTETKDELLKTLDLMLEIHKIHRQSSFTVGSYLPYPGTPLYELAVKEGFLPPRNTEEWNRIDRWKNSFCLPWVNNKIVLHVRTLMSMLSWKIGLLNKWIIFRIKHRILLFSYDIKLFIYARNIFEKYIKRKRCSNKRP